MTLTLLLDLDETLLGNPLDCFMAAYLESLARCMTPIVAPDKMVPALLKATHAMMHSARCDRRLEETFSQAFYPVLGIDPQQARPILEAFYAEDFPQLQSYTQRKPEALKLVQQALAQGYRVAVATAPLFPRTAILQRLAWAGLPADQIPFALISSFESFHFTKPNPAYFAEFLAQMGWPDGPIVMVGDDPEQDIKPARELGLPVFWTPADVMRPWEDSAAPAPARGSLTDVLTWIDSQPANTLLPDYSSPAALKAILRSTPAALATLCAQQEPEIWVQRPSSTEWCSTEIICHFRDVEKEVNLPRVQRILQEENPFITGRDTDAWAEQRQYIRENLPDALKTFIQHRLRLMEALDRLEAADWQRQVRHAIFGPTNFHDLLRIMADHDRLHVQQIFRAQHQVVQS